MAKRAAAKIIEGLEQAADYSRVRNAVHTWIREDCPMAVQMSLMPEHVAKLVDRICGSTTRFVQPKTKR